MKPIEEMTMTETIEMEIEVEKERNQIRAINGTLNALMIGAPFALVGFGIGMYCGVHTPRSPEYGTIDPQAVVRVFERAPKPAVMSVHSGGVDQILVEKGNSSEYLPLSRYLGTISNEADRASQEAEIQKVVGW